MDMAVLESAIRDDLETKAARVMAVVNPLKVVITNFEEGKTESREAGFHPQHPEFGSRIVPFGREIWIEADDFSEAPPAGWQRLALGGEVRLRYSLCDALRRGDQGCRRQLGRIALLDRS